jgi:hypothetical protein
MITQAKETGREQPTRAVSRADYELLGIAGLNPTDPKCFEKLESTYKGKIQSQLFNRLYDRLIGLRQLIYASEPAYRNTQAA